MTSRNHFQEVFQELEIKGFKTTSILSWSFFFFSENKDNLQKVINELDGYGYSTEISKVGEDYRLIANKAEILTFDKLERRTKAFAELGEYCDVQFDGWEVSKLSN